MQLDVVDVTRIGRMVKLALEGSCPDPPPDPLPYNVIRGRFERPTSHFAVRRQPDRTGVDDESTRHDLR